MMQSPRLLARMQAEPASFLVQTCRNAGPRRREPVSFAAGGSACATRRRWVASSVTLRRLDEPFDFFFAADIAGKRHRLSAPRPDLIANFIAGFLLAR